jgi:predicted acetyltransferase
LIQYLLTHFIKNDCLCCKVRVRSRFSRMGEVKMELRRPTLADKETILSMVAEFEETQSAHDGGFWDAEAFVYEAWLESNRDMEMGLGIPEGWVPAVQLVAFARDGQAVGFLNLRLRLSAYLLEEGGHIGYSIRPSERGKGYAKEALHQGLQVAKEKNIHRALVTCSTENPASRAVILANGGQFEDVRNGTERYWIEVD